jgi:Zn-dependent peptidase ImmA (M78 family)
MVNRDEILGAIYEAARLHKQFGSEQRVEAGASRVDVYEMILARDIPVLFRPLKNLFGAYITDPGEGVMVTTKIPLPVQRFTAAHELGHAALGHEASLDDQEVLTRPIFSSELSDDPREDQANAFAAELLTPDWLIEHHMVRQGWTPDSLTEPTTVYQLALRMGSSYSATCYALANCDIIDWAIRDRLLKAKLKEIKQALVAPYEPVNWRRDVWLVTERDTDLVLEGSRSDLVVWKFREHTGSGYMWQFGDLADAGLAIVNDGRSTNGSEEHIGGIVFRTVLARTEDGAAGHVNLRETRPWLPKGKPLNSFEFDVDLTGPVPAGLHPSLLQAALVGAA